MAHSSDDRRTLLLSGTGLGWIFGLVLAAMAWQDYWNYVIEETHPVRMRFSDQPKRESIGTQHITLTDFYFGDGYACETGAAALVSASVHVFPNAVVGESVVKLHTIFAIVESRDIQDEDELLKVIRQEELTGVLSSQPYWPGVTRGHF